MSSLFSAIFRKSHSHTSSSTTSSARTMGSCLSRTLTTSNGPSPPISKFSSTAFGRKSYIEIEKQADVKRGLLDEDYYSDEEDLGLSKRKGEKTMELEMDLDESYNLLHKALPQTPEDGDEPPFEGMVKVWSSSNEGAWMWPRGVQAPVEISDDYVKWRAQRDIRLGGAK